jgi:hypothetical protein
MDYFLTNRNKEEKIEAQKRQERQERQEQNDKELKYLLLKLAEKTKEKKPHNIRIKNRNPNEPKIKPDTRYSEKQKYRIYKTKIEPNKLDKIKIDEEDDIVAKIREAFDKERNDTKSHLVEVAPNPYIEPPNNKPHKTETREYEEELEVGDDFTPRVYESEVFDISPRVAETATGFLATPLKSASKFASGVYSSMFPPKPERLLLGYGSASTGDVSLLSVAPTVGSESILGVRTRSRAKTEAKEGAREGKRPVGRPPSFIERYEGRSLDLTKLDKV